MLQLILRKESEGLCGYTQNLTKTNNASESDIKPLVGVTSNPGEAFCRLGSASCAAWLPPVRAVSAHLVPLNQPWPFISKAAQNKSAGLVTWSQ